MVANARYRLNAKVCMKILSALFIIAVICPPSVWAQKKPLTSGIYQVTGAKQTKGGTDELLLSGSTTMLSSLDITLSSLTPGEKSKLETQPDVERLIIVVEGKVSITAGNQSKIVSEGSVALSVPGDRLILQSSGSGAVRFYLLRFKAKPSSVQRKEKSQGSFIVDWNETTFKPHERGGRRDIFDRATGLFERFEMHVTTLSKGLSSHDPHKHNAEEIILLRRGAAEMFIAGEQVAMDAGDVALLDSQVLHGITKGGRDEREYYAFQWEVTK